MGDRWRDLAACDGRSDIDWFPSRPPGRNRYDASPTPMVRKYRQNLARALAVCRVCPVRAACLRDAVAHDDPGIRGGTTEDERRGAA